MNKKPSSQGYFNEKMIKMLEKGEKTTDSKSNKGTKTTNKPSKKK